ncbi:MAG TPA: hypothetical protein P5531_03970 [Bacteroidales bacterium]|nr:hypothetical protein [Bacteroidales bacterium]
MAIQFTKTEDSAYKSPFLANLENIPGGVCVAVTDLVEDEVTAGTPIGLDSNTGLYHVVKTAQAQNTANNSATDYKFVKGHNFAVGQFIMLGTGKKAYAITAIDTSNASYDLVSVGTTLGENVTTASIFIEATAETGGTDSDFKYTPAGLVGTSFDITAGANHFVDCVVRGSVVESLCVPIHADIKTQLSLIRFV